MEAAFVHPAHTRNFSVIVRKSGRTDFTENFCYTIHSNSPNPEMLVSGNSQSSTSLYIPYRHKFFMYMYTTIKNTSSVTLVA